MRAANPGDILEGVHDPAAPDGGGGGVSFSAAPCPATDAAFNACTRAARPADNPDGGRSWLLLLPLAHGDVEFMLIACIRVASRGEIRGDSVDDGFAGEGGPGVSTVLPPESESTDC